MLSLQLMMLNTEFEIIKYISVAFTLRSFDYWEFHLEDCLAYSLFIWKLLFWITKNKTFIETAAFISHIDK